MKKLTALLIALAVVSLAAPAFAQSQENDDTPSQLIVIDAKRIQGDITNIDVFWEDHKDRPEFGPISRIKTSFIEKIGDSTNDNALR